MITVIHFFFLNRLSPELVPQKLSAGESATRECRCSTTELRGPTCTRGRIRTCDHPLLRRSNPRLHHRPNLNSLPIRQRGPECPRCMPRHSQGTCIAVGGSNPGTTKAATKLPRKSPLTEC